MVPIKDIKTFIVAAKAAADVIPDAEFHCIGPTDEDPGYFHDCELLVSNLRLQDIFHFHGRQDVRDYYCFLDVLLLTSIREAQPLVILEGYSAGVPVISTKVGNVAELLDYDQRFLANPKDAEKIASAIKFVHDNPQEMQRVCERNKERVNTFYERTVLHRRYRELYNQFAGVK